MRDGDGAGLRGMFALAEPGPVTYRVLSRVDETAYVLERIEYEGDDGAPIPAFLLTPKGPERVGGVVAYHQHNGQFHFGKSEVTGLVGDPLQAFGPALAKRGFVVLVPDAITFEDRRNQVHGTQPGEGDWLQHYNGMAYRLQNGDLMMRKCLDDAQRALGAVLTCPGVDADVVGVVGHSFGGTVAMYQAALDRRCQFSCISGAVCSYAQRQRSGTGIGMIEVVPGIARELEVADVIRAIQPRPLLVVSATEDKYSADADEVLREAGPSRATTHYRVEGGHALDRARFDTIIEWMTTQALTRTCA